MLHVTPSFHPAHVYGGTTRSVYDLCRYLAGQGCDLKVLTTDANGPSTVLDVDTTMEVADPNGFGIRYCHRVKDVSLSAALLRVLSGYIKWSDVVHLTAVYSFPTIPTLSLARLLGRPVIWSPRGMLQRWEGSKRVRLKAIWDRVCALASPRKLVLHFTSEQEAEESTKRFAGVDYVVIPNCLDVPERPEVPQPGPDDSLRLLYLGRLDPKKGIENLLNACAALRRSNGLHWQLTVAGDGEPEYAGSLKRLVQETGLANDVRMIGAVAGAGKEQTLARADVVVVPSYTENFGIVVAEALAHGKPVIASQGTPWQRVEQIGCGLWVDNSPESLATAIRQVSTMPLKEMGQRGRRWISAEFSGNSVAKRMLEVYEGLAITGRAQSRR